MQCCLPKRQCVAGSCSSSLPTLATLEQERRTPKISKNVFDFFPIYGFPPHIIVCETRVQWVGVLKTKKVYFLQRFEENLNNAGRGISGLPESTCTGKKSQSNPTETKKNLAKTKRRGSHHRLGNARAGF